MPRAIIIKKYINIFLAGSINHKRKAKKQVKTDEIIRKIFLFFKISEQIPRIGALIARTKPDIAKT